MGMGSSWPGPLPLILCSFFPFPLKPKAVWGCHALNLNHSLHWYLLITSSGTLDTWRWWFADLFLVLDGMWKKSNQNDEGPERLALEEQQEESAIYWLNDLRRLWRPLNEHLRVEMMTRDGKKTSSFRGRQRRMRCVWYWAVETHLESVIRALHLRRWKWMIK